MNDYREIRIEYMEDAERLSIILANNGYSVTVNPVYESIDDIKKRYRGRLPSCPIKATVKEYAVHINGTVMRPEVYNDD
jgi:hypothetical protein